MTMVAKDLWPAAFPAKSVPAPVAILREQGLVLQQKTNGLLYGEVLESAIPFEDSLRYSFYVCISRKPTRHKLMSIECPVLSDYPVLIDNHLVSYTARVYDESEFENAIRLILEAPETQDVIGRLMTFASHV